MEGRRKKVAKNIFFQKRDRNKSGFTKTEEEEKMLYVTSFVNFFNPRRLKALT